MYNAWLKSLYLGSAGELREALLVFWLPGSSAGSPVETRKG